MKCPRCGFVSFDYLSECKKCSADLRSVREKLGFSDLKPSNVVYLEALLSHKHNELSIAGADEVAADTNPLTLTPEDIPESELNIAHIGNTRISAEDESPPVLELWGPVPIPLVPQEGVEESPGLEPSMDYPSHAEGLPPKEQPNNLEVLSHAVVRLDYDVLSSDIPTIELSEADINGLLETVELDTKLKAETSPISEQVHGSTPLEAGITTASPHPDPGFVIDLSNEDIDTLLLELGETAQEKPGAKSDTPQKLKEGKYDP